MISELLLMQLASDQQKKQTHDQPQFPCSAYFTNWEPHKIEGVPWHWHRELEFMVVIKGQTQVSFDGKTFLLHRGDGFFCNSRTLHQIQMADCTYCSVNSLVFDASLISGGPGTVYDEKYIAPLVSSHSFSGMILSHLNDRHQEILNHIRIAHKNCQEESDGYEFEVRYHLSQALLHILQQNRDALSAESSGSRQMSRVRKMLDYIHQNYASPVSITDLSLSANICERECQRCFRQILQQSPMDYLQQYRIQIAGKLLLETQLSVLDVGLSVGFSNPSHFCKIFKSYMNLSPGRYRRENTKNPPG